MIDFADLCARAALLFNVDVAALKTGTGRSRRLNDARQAVAYVLYDHRYTVVEIGNLLHRDHSTICYALKQARQRKADEPSFAEQLDELAIISAVPLEPPPPPPRITTVTPQLRLAVTLYGVAVAIAA